VEASLQSLHIAGLPEPVSTQPPTLVSSHGVTVDMATAGETFVNLLFETNPLDGTCDTRIKLSAGSLETTFDAVCMTLSITCTPACWRNWYCFYRHLFMHHLVCLSLRAKELKKLLIGNRCNLMGTLNDEAWK